MTCFGDSNVHRSRSAGFGYASSEHGATSFLHITPLNVNVTAGTSGQWTGLVLPMFTMHWARYILVLRAPAHRAPLGKAAAPLLRSSHAAINLSRSQRQTANKRWSCVRIRRRAGPPFHFLHEGSPIMKRILVACVPILAILV